MKITAALLLLTSLALPCALAAQAPDPLADVEAAGPGKAHGILSDAQKEAIISRAEAEIAKRVGSKIDARDPLAAPAAWTYRLKSGQVKMDMGGSYAMERWDCRLIPGRACFAGIVAGKATVGVAAGFGLRSIAALLATPEGLPRRQLVLWAGFVIPYDSSGAQASPAVGASFKF